MVERQLHDWILARRQRQPDLLIELLSRPVAPVVGHKHKSALQKVFAQASGFLGAEVQRYRRLA